MTSSMKTRYRLFLLAHGRSGDKGDKANIGIIARRPDWYPWLVRNLTAQRVAGVLAPLEVGSVLRYELENLGALNFVVSHALGGGGAVSLRLDAQGKTLAPALLRAPISLPPDLERAVLDHWGAELPSDCVLESSAAFRENPADLGAESSDSSEEGRPS